VWIATVAADKLMGKAKYLRKVGSSSLAASKTRLIVMPSRFTRLYASFFT
jgi:hypothetical protein